jgi:hypothetical protein
MNELERIRNIRVKLALAKDHFENGLLTTEEFGEIADELKKEIENIRKVENDLNFFKNLIK